MRTKYILYIEDEVHEITSEHIRNWDQIQCAYSRKDFNGVVRSFTSQFEFVGIAYDLLFNLYLKEGVKATAILSILTLSDRWEWEEQFKAPLDFSTISWDPVALSISAIDNNLAALISANKNTKFEFLIGTDIIPNYPLLYDRIEMQNSVVHELMSNASEEFSNGCVSLGEASDFRRAMVYVVGNAETYENSPISFADQNEDSGSHFFKIERSGSSLQLNVEIMYDGRTKNPFDSVINNCEIHLMQFTSANPDYNSSYRDIATVFKYSESDWLGSGRRCLGVFASFDALKKAFPNPESDVYAIIGSSEKRKDAEAVYYTPVTNGKVEWIQGEITTRPNSNRGNEYAYCRTHKFIYSFDMSSYAPGSMFALLYKANIKYDLPLFGKEKCIGLTSKISMSWISRGKPITIDALTPQNVLQTIINKISENHLNVTAHIDNSDTRLDKTYILSAESIRNIPNAKFYSSFSEFCDWIQTVFGYTYYLGEIKKSQYDGFEYFDGSIGSFIIELIDGVCPAEYCSDLIFLHDYGKFGVYNNHDGKFYTRWEAFEDKKDWTAYNDIISGKARKDKIFIYSMFGTSFFVNDEFMLQASPDGIKAALDKQDIFFIHRDKLFAGTEIQEIKYVRNVNYSVDASVIYSAIEVGYDKKDYEAECGRDEWNFTSTYSTGFTVTDKTLSLKSKYRADCYGLEFLAQKRALDSTDDKSDKDVFFVHCSIKEEIEESEDSSTRGEDEEEYITTSKLEIDRSINIKGALSSTVFNGEYSPYFCLKANERFIAKMGSPVNLKFASSDGNSEVSFNNIPANSDLTLVGDLLTLGQVSFTTGEVDFPKDPNALISFAYRGITYKGFLMSVELKYAHEESAKYKLIVKEIEV